ncbi:MAG TPA: hypothetical protein VHB50_00570, partial [Bryobacteraceae bacterium]|nr:hypothetical protein [Bryobacteraceae bacterium]
KAYVYDTALGKLKDVSPQNSSFATTLGLRSAGSIGDTVFLAGPGLSGGVNFFAFSSSASAYIASCTASQFNNIRQWRVINNALYAGVGNTAGGGGLVRWNGTPSQPFDSTASATCGFEVVANLPGDAAYITAYGPASDRIAVSTWPNPLGAPGATAGVYLSPQMPAAGFTSSDANTPWTPLWLPSLYEPDPVTALTDIGGGIAYWNGALYFGTMHVPGLSALAHTSAYPNDTESSLTVFANTYRAISVWRIQNADTIPSVQLLYGESALPKFDPGTNTFQSTSTGYSPLYGSSGFGNVFNNYTWSAAVFQDRLFFGTMDWSYLAYEGLLGAAPQQQNPQGQNQGDSQSFFGADLWRFDSGSRPAVAENANGLGNYLNYGLRTMITSADGQNLFVGTANPMNLEAKGGWELRRLKLRNPQNSQ